MNEKEIQTKELYPFINDAVKKMNISIENIKWANEIITHNKPGYLDDIDKIQKYVENIIDNACVVFKEKITKGLSVEDILLYAQVAKTVQEIDKLKNIPVVTKVKNVISNKADIINDKKISDDDTFYTADTNIYKVIQRDLFGNVINPQEIKKRKFNGKSQCKKVTDTIKLYENFNDVPYPKGKQSVYRLAVCIPKRLANVKPRGKSLVYGRIPIVYFISENKDRDYIIARNNFVKLIRQKYNDALHEYEKKYVSIGHDISIKKVSVL